MSTDDRLTMTLYRHEQDKVKMREQFNNDMQFIFQKAKICRDSHRHPTIDPDDAFCVRCLDEIHSVVLTRDAIHPPFIEMSEMEVCALVRQLFRNHIPFEGISGPVVHALLGRIQRQLGASRYSEFVDGAFPDRLKPPDSGPILSKK